MKNSKFDLDLAKGKVGEAALAAILACAKIEVKSEYKYWKKTGNIAIELECNKKPSGINTTEAEYWCHILMEDGEPVMMFLTPVKVLKTIVEHWVSKNGTIMGGDGYRSKMVLIPMSGLTESLLSSKA